MALPISYVGERAIFQGAGTTSVVIPIASNATAGNQLFLFFGNRNTSLGSASVADTRGGTWYIDSGPLREPGNAYGFLASTPQDNGPLTTADSITITLGGSPTLPMALIEEFSGLAPRSMLVDEVSSFINPSGQSSDTSATPGATDQDVELVLNSFAWDDVASGITLGSGYSTFTTGSRSNSGKTLTAQYLITSTAGIQQGGQTTTGAAQGSVGLLATYRAAPVLLPVAPTPDFIYMMNMQRRR